MASFVDFIITTYQEELEDAFNELKSSSISDGIIPSPPIEAETSDSQRGTHLTFIFHTHQDIIASAFLSWISSRVDSNVGSTTGLEGEESYEATRTQVEFNFINHLDFFLGFYRGLLSSSITSNVPPTTGLPGSNDALGYLEEDLAPRAKFTLSRATPHTNYVGPGVNNHYSDLHYSTSHYAI